MHKEQYNSSGGKERYQKQNIIETMVEVNNKAKINPYNGSCPIKMITW